VLEICGGNQIAVIKNIKDLESEINIIYKKYKLPYKLVEHMQHVANMAISLCAMIGRKGHFVNCAEVFLGAALHDIGYIRVKGVQHGIVGAEMAIELGYSENIAKIIKRHIVGGLSKELISSSNLDLPHKDFLPRTIEEKIVACADQLFHKRSKTGIYLVEDPSQNERVAKNIYRLYDEVFYLCFNPVDKVG